MLRPIERAELVRGGAVEGGASRRALASASTSCLARSAPNCSARHAISARDDGRLREREQAPDLERRGQREVLAAVGTTRRSWSLSWAKGSRPSAPGASRVVGWAASGPRYQARTPVAAPGQVRQADVAGLGQLGGRARRSAAAAARRAARQAPRAPCRAGRRRARASAARSRRCPTTVNDQWASTGKR